MANRGPSGRQRAAQDLETRRLVRVDDQRVLTDLLDIEIEERRGAICPSLTVPTPPATTASCDGAVPAEWDLIFDAVSHRDDAEVQLHDSAVVRAHQHAMCISRSAKEDFGVLAAD